jgi:hypothetical protein
MACGNAIKRNVQIQSYFAMVCDRIYCPSTPSAQKYIKDHQKDASSACGPIGSQTAASIFSRSLSQSYTNADVLNINFVRNSDACAREYYDQWHSSCLGYSLLSQKDIVQASRDNALGNESTGIPGMIDRLTNMNFCSAARDQEDVAFREGEQWYIQDPNNQDCYVLGGPETESALVESRRSGVAIFNQSSRQGGVVDSTTVIQQEGGPRVTHCVRTDPQGQLYFVPSDNRGNPVTFQRQGERNTTTGTYLGQERTVQNLPGHDGVYIGEDNSLYKMDSPGNLQVYTDSRVYVSRNQAGELQYYVGKEGNATTKKGPERLRGNPVPDYLIRSSDSFFSALRCVCLPAVNAYLQQIRNILAAIRQCFQGVLITKEFNSGMCRAVLTQYVCDWIFEALGCFISAASPSDQALIDSGSRSEIQYGLTSIGRAGKRTQAYASGRYGDTSSFQSLFTQRKLLHAICLAALGYDWLPDIEAAVGTQGQFPIESTGLIAPATRQFMSANPIQQGITTYIYHVGYFLTAGEDINYRVELVCSSAAICSHSDNYEGGICDCAHGPTQVPNIAPQEFVQQAPGGAERFGSIPPGANRIPTGTNDRIFVIDQGFLRQGQMTEGTGKGEIYQAITDTVRYDRVRLTWTATRQGRPGGFVEMRINEIGEVPIECSFNLILMRFSCGAFSGGEEKVMFTQPPQLVTNRDDGLLGTSEQIRFSMRIFTHEDNDDRIVQGQIPYYVKISLFDEKNNKIGNDFVSAKGDIHNAAMPLILPRSGTARIYAQCA